MNIQIFGKSKCFDTKKAQRYFKERRVKFQTIDLNKYGISKGELTSVLRSVKLADLIDPKHPDAALLQYLAYDQDKVEKILENPTLLKTPIVRNGKQATVGYQPDIWKGWE
ncbi:MAG: ArsC family transcriptional regulator [Clostridiales bacterium]|nr:ArsC family transcriptional regulator [Clostridiales bacterium]MDY4172574.1 ArsC/Spx/MgsR family protein [Evtepia sp.]